MKNSLKIKLKISRTRKIKDININFFFFLSSSHYHCLFVDNFLASRDQLLNLTVFPLLKIDF